MAAGRTKKRRLRRAGLLVGVAFVGLLAFTGYQAWQARSALQGAADDLDLVAARLSDGDVAAAGRALESAHEQAASARSNTSGPVWWLGSHLPWVGDDLSAVRLVTGVLDDLTGGPLPRIVDASQGLSADALRTPGGRFDLGPLRRAAPVIAKGSEEVAAAESRVADIDTAALFTVLRGPVADVQARLLRTRELADRAARVARLLPPMLGGDGRRTYLAIFQNNAELRATGGIPGAVAVLTADGGRLTMSAQGTAGDLGYYAEPILPLTAEEKALFTKRLGTFPQNITLTPDFPRTAELAKAMWERQTGRHLDGVISVDPVTLAYLLQATGPVRLPNGDRLRADNVVGQLLNTVYLTIPDQDEENTYFADAARAVFEVVASGRGDAGGMLDGITQSAAERRLMVWSAHSREQGLLAGTPIAGDLPADPTARPQVGVYLNDSASDKMSFYLDYTVDVTAQGCRPDGVRELGVRVELSSLAPAAARSFPDSVAGTGVGGAARGDLRHTVLLYLPFGGRLTGAELDGAPAPVAEFRHLERGVVAVTVDLKPGESRTLDYDVTTGPGQTGAVELRTTPAAITTGQGEVAGGGCS